ncbi:MAG: glycogen debranching enzyme family protein [Candidatus Rokubacteria bacterium]|nr:glycogen debranching enzyme family protein [Candidatus Rokubacteria bacterium]
MTLAWGREVCGRLAVAESREWLCTNGIGGFASGTVAGLTGRRYHGLLVAALDPPLGRTLLVTKVDETVEYETVRRPLFANRWRDGQVDPHGYVEIESFRLDGTTPVWTYAIADALIEKRVWMEQGANTTYAQYRLLRGQAPASLELKVLANYRDYHATTQANGWPMRIERVPDGVKVTAFDGARPYVLLAAGAEVREAHDWHHGFSLAGEAARGLDHVDDNLHVATFRVRLAAGRPVTLVASAEAAPSLDGAAAGQRRAQHEADLMARWASAQPVAKDAPDWIRHCVLGADQFIATRQAEGAAEPDGATVIAGYHWFGDWGRDTMISLPGLTLTTGRPELAKKILTTFARFVDRGMLPNRFPDQGEPPEYNTVDATLWYVDAIRGYVAATDDDATLRELFPVLEEIVQWHRQGTRYGIKEDPSDGLLRAGESGVQLTWMDAKVGDWVVTPRIGKPVEINALWYNAARSMAWFAKRLGKPAAAWDQQGERIRRGFERFWHPRKQYLYDVLDGPTAFDDALRPNQIFAVSLPESPLTAERQKRVVDVCARHLLTSYGLRSLAPGERGYCPRYGGDVVSRDGAYHQGTVWAWLLGPFVRAHFKVYGDRAAALAMLAPLADHLGDFGVGSIAEVFDAEPPFLPGGCIAQAWSVSETLRAWAEIARIR